MSFDLQIIPARPGLTPDMVNSALERMEEGEACPFGEPTDMLRACLAEIIFHHPPMSPMTDEESESSIWSADPDCVDGYIGLCMRWSTTPEQINRIIGIAHKHGFAVYNPQTDSIHMPPSSMGGRTVGLSSRFRKLFRH